MKFVKVLLLAALAMAFIYSAKGLITFQNNNTLSQSDPEKGETQGESFEGDEGEVLQDSQTPLAASPEAAASVGSTLNTREAFVWGLMGCCCLGFVCFILYRLKRFISIK